MPFADLPPSIHRKQINIYRVDRVATDQGPPTEMIPKNTNQHPQQQQPKKKTSDPAANSVWVVFGSRFEGLWPPSNSHKNPFALLLALSDTVDPFILCAPNYAVSNFQIQFAFRNTHINKHQMLTIYIKCRPKAFRRYLFSVGPLSFLAGPRNAPGPADGRPANSRAPI